MNAWPAGPDDGSRRRSRNIALVFIGAVTVAGGLAAWEAWQRAQASSARQPSPQPAAPPVSADQVYTNNAFIPGVGYYHAPYHAWFPHPFNYYDPVRGYYAGGLWQAAPFLVSLLNSRPSNDAVATALATQRLREDLQRKQQQQAQSSTGSSGGMFFRGSGFGGSGFSSTAPGGSTPTGSGGGSSISRGGFGSSAHGACGGGE